MTWNAGSHLRVDCHLKGAPTHAHLPIFVYCLVVCDFNVMSSVVYFYLISFTQYSKTN